MKKSLYFGIFLLLICISLIIYNELSNKNLYQTNIYNVTNSASKEENVKVYLKATFVAGSINYNNENYYVIFGDGVQYLVKIDDEKAYKIHQSWKKRKQYTSTAPSKDSTNGAKAGNQRKL